MRQRSRTQAVVHHWLMLHCVPALVCEPAAAQLQAEGEVGLASAGLEEQQPFQH
jgi:hypothetical protein